MDILNIQTLSGPNYWSNKRKQLIVVKLDLLQYEYLPTNKLDRFSENLKQLLPTLFNHFCSEGKKGGFFSRVDDGTWLGHVIEHVALELQWLAGMPCGFGRTRSTDETGVYHVVFSYEIKEAGLYAAHAAIKLVTHLAKGKTYPLLSHDISQLKRIKSEKGFGPSTLAIVQEAEKRNIPYNRLDDGSFVMLGQGCYQQFICATTTSKTSSIGVDNVSDKNITKQILSSAYIPTPKGYIIQSRQQLDDALDTTSFPCVIKPVDGNHGRGITTNIRSIEQAHVAFDAAKKIGDKIIIEKMIMGSDYRFLVVNYNVVAVARRIPACIIGDGVSTVEQLIDLVNDDPNRGYDHDAFLTRITIDETTLSILSEQSLTVDSVLPLNQILYLKHVANLSAGGTATDVTDQVHPHTIFLANRVARLMNLDICGIDMLIDNIAKPLTENNGAVLEVNAGPGFRMHLAPTHGIKRNVAKPVIDMLYPQNAPSRIPIVAVTGTNGKTTTVRLIAHLAKEAGFSVGFTSTEGIYINHQKIVEGDCSGPASAKTVLRDPVVNFAVMECARGGIIRSGLGFDYCNISVITNITEDHLGQDDIHTLDDLARVKEVVARSTMQEGYSILNADDDLVYKMKSMLDCNIALFSLTYHDRIVSHCKAGGLAAYLENGNIVVKKGEHESVICQVNSIPLSFGGLSSCMSQNILSAVLVGVICNYKLTDITKWLTQFLPTPDNLPGRMNLFHVNNRHVLIDYGHNEAAFVHLKHYFSHLAATKKIGIIAATGDRRPSDIQKVGFHCAHIFDEIIIRHDKDNRGRSNEEQTCLLMEGIKQAGSPCQKVHVISDEKEAIDYALATAAPGAYILYFPERVVQATDYLKKRQQQVGKLSTTSF